MKNISVQYQDLLEGKMSQAQFLRNARMMFPSFVTNHNSFDDSVAILKQKGMLNEGDAVKGTPDKEPTYDSLTPDDKVKYKKVEQLPEVDEQDGIYPATTITDIPKTKTYKKVKNTSDGLEPIKDNDTKNELKKVKIVKENIHNTISMGGVLGGRNYKAEDEEDKAATFEIRDLIKSGMSEEDAFEQVSEKYRLRPDYLKRKYNLYAKENIAPEEIDQAEVEITTNDASIQAMADKMGISQEELFKLLLKKLGGLDEVQRSFDDIFADFVETDDSTEIKAYFKSKGKDAINKLKTEFPDKVRQVLSKIVKENQINEAGTAPDAKAVIDLIGKNTMLLNKLKMINNKEELQPVFDFLLTKISQTIAKNTQQVKTATTTSAQNYSKTGGMGSITEKDAPKLESLISKIMNETLSKKSAI